MIVSRPISTNFGGIQHADSALQGAGPLKPGQRLDAVVLSRNDLGQVALRIGNYTLTASTSLVLQQNTHIVLEVVKTQPQLLLRLIPDKAARLAPNTIQEVLTRLLPSQTGLAPSLAGLVQKSLSGHDSVDRSQLQKLLNSLANAVPGRSSMTRASGVQQAILQSGLLLETLLAKSGARIGAHLSRDIKANLLLLQQHLDQYPHDSALRAKRNNIPPSAAYNTVAPPRRKGLPVPQQRAAITPEKANSPIVDDIADMIIRTRGAIARLGLLQLATAENFSEGNQLWQFEIPVKHADTVEIVSLSIAREHKKPSFDDADAWLIRLAVDLPQLGEVHIRISFFSQGVSTTFWSDSATTRNLLENQLDSLRSRLGAFGIKCLNLSCLEGFPEEPSEPDPSVSNLDLLV